MTGLELARAFWEEVGRPAFHAHCPQVLDRAAVGLVGEGSECFGFDDEISRDHDWGPGFCLWLTGEDLQRLAPAARAVWDRLPRQFWGFARLREDPLSAGRVGILDTDGFYRHFLALDHLPETPWEWNLLPEAGLAAATNGQVFSDPLGAFTQRREHLLAYYPEDVRRKRLAAHCALAAQSGQYNYPRCLKRGETVAAFSALGEFLDHAQAAVFLLCRTYRPYYKWSHRAMTALPGPGAKAAGLCARLIQSPLDAQREIEALSALLIDELRRQNLSASGSDFLLPHARDIQEGIRDSRLRELHLMIE